MDIFVARLFGAGKSCVYLCAAFFLYKAGSKAVEPEVEASN